MTSPSSSTSSSSANGYLAIVLGASFVVVAAATALAYAGAKAHFIDFSFFHLYGHQIEKLAAARDVDTLFVGDSTLGNAIDADAWTEFTGRRALNVALTGKFGYAGSYNMLRRSLERFRPRNVIVMQTAEMPSRRVSAKGYFLTLPKGDSYGLEGLNEWFKFMVNAETAGSAIKGLVRRLGGRPGEQRIRSDYIQQGAPLREALDDPEYMGQLLRPVDINPEKAFYLRKLAALCADEGLNCLSVHGPLLDHFCHTWQEYLRAADAALRRTGIEHIDGTPYCFPAAIVGDSKDHIAPSEKVAATAVYAELLAPHLE